MRFRKTEEVSNRRIMDQAEQTLKTEGYILRRFTGLPDSFRGSNPSSPKLTTFWFW